MPITRNNSTNTMDVKSLLLSNVIRGLTESPDNPGSKRAKLSYDIRLCDECLKIDFANVFQKADEHFFNSAVNVTKMLPPQSSKEGLHVRSFSGYVLVRSICPMCRFFGP